MVILLFERIFFFRLASHDNSTDPAIDQEFCTQF